MRIVAGNPVAADAPLTLAVAADVSCTDAARNCAALKLSVTAVFNPIVDPDQTAHDWTYADDNSAPYQFIFPTGYGDGEDGATGRQLAIIGLQGGGDLTQLLADGVLALDSAGELSFGPSGAKQLNAGSYVLTAGMSNPDRLLGTVALAVEIEVAKANLDAAVYQIADQAPADKIQVVAGYGGGHLLFVTIAADLDAVIRTPNPPPDVVLLERQDSNRRVAVRLNQDLAGAEFSAVLTLSVPARQRRQPQRPGATAGNHRHRPGHAADSGGRAENGGLHRPGLL